VARFCHRKFETHSLHWYGADFLQVKSRHIYPPDLVADTRRDLSSKHLHKNRKLTTRFSGERTSLISYCFLEPIEQGMAAVQAAGGSEQFKKEQRYQPDTASALGRSVDDLPRGLLLLL
jgi:hypothetical protein